MESVTHGFSYIALWHVLECIIHGAMQVQVLEEKLGDLPTMGSATRAEIADVLKTYTERNVNAWRIISGLVKTKQMQPLAHWVTHFRGVGGEVTFQGI